jgi:hypothetical protein
MWSWMKRTFSGLIQLFVSWASCKVVRTQERGERTGITKEIAKSADRRGGVRFASALTWTFYDLAQKVS